MFKNREFWLTAKKIQDRATISSIKAKFDLQDWQNNFRYATCKKYINQQRIGFQIWLNLINYGSVSKEGCNRSSDLH